MGRNSDGTVDFNPAFFDRIMKSAEVENLTKKRAEAALAIAQHTAPVDSGEYRDRLKVEQHNSDYRTVFRVVGTDWKTLLIEAKTGNLARAVKAVKGL